MKFTLEIITPERRAFEQEVDAVYVPTADGRIGVLSHHMPLFTHLTEGEVRIVDEQKEYYLAIGGGFMEVGKNRVSVLVSRAVHADELNEAEIRKALETAKQTIANRAQGEELRTAQSLFRRSSLELRVLRRRRHTGTPSLSS